MFQIFSTMGDKSTKYINLVLSGSTDATPLSCIHLGIYLFLQLYVRPQQKKIYDTILESEKNFCDCIFIN